MLTALRCGFFGLALLQVCIAPPATAGDASAGIVMAASGATDPPLSPMTEIAANTPIRLEAGSRVTFLEYGRCKLVTVSGGTLTLTQSGYSTDGHVEGENDGPCPQTFSLASSALGAGAPTTAALVLRGAAGAPHWPINAQLLLTGSRGGDFGAATVSPEGQPGSQAATFAVAAGKLVAPTAALPLLPNRRYVLRLIPADPAKSNELTFVGGAAKQPRPLVILRLD